MIEREEGYEGSDISDGERRAVFFDVGRALVGPPRPDGKLSFDEGQLAHVASKSFYDEVWHDLLEVYHGLQTAVTEHHMRAVLDDAKERHGIPVEICEGEERAAGRIVALVGYHPDFPDALTGVAVMGGSDTEVPVAIWPRFERVETLKIMQ